MVSKVRFREQIYKIVKQIPKGRVATYGLISGMIIKSQDTPIIRIIGVRRSLMSRAVGNVLHANCDSGVPCYRVVDRNGRLAPNFGGPSLESFGRRAFFAKDESVFGRGGWEEQKRRLLEEGVEFVDENHVDLSKCLWQC